MTHTGTIPASRSTALAAERYVSLTTYRRDGTPIHTPVWPVEAGDGRLAFITSSRTWKAKRIANDPRVELRPCDARGRTGAEPATVHGTADVVTGDAYVAIRERVRAKYGYQLQLIDLLHKLPGDRTGHPTDCAVVISVAEG